MADRGSPSAFDEYDLKARLAPAFITLVPPTFLLLLWWPTVMSLGEAAVAGLVGMALLVALTFLVASQGARLERKWGDAIGKPHSARLLSHSATDFSAAEKAKIHGFFERHGQPIPSAEEEAEDGEGAQESRMVAVGWLITVSRPEAKSTLLLKENIGYGFWRNLRALKWPALAVAFASLALDLYLVARIGRDDPDFARGVAVAVVCALTILFLVVFVTRKAVVQASLAYARRLFALRDEPNVAARAGGSATSPVVSSP